MPQRQDALRTLGAALPLPQAWQEQGPRPDRPADADEPLVAEEPDAASEPVPTEAAPAAVAEAAMPTRRRKRAV